MKFKENKILVKSTSKFWGKEFTGEKPYTVRILGKEEYEKLLKFYERYKHYPIGFLIEVELVREPTSKNHFRNYFTRKVQDVTLLGEILGKFLVGISWEVEKNV